MGLVMREWYGISIHLLTVFCIGVAVGMSVTADDIPSAGQPVQAQPTAQQQPAIMSDKESYQFMKNWCAANF